MRATDELREWIVFGIERDVRVLLLVGDAGHVIMHNLTKEWMMRADGTEGKGRK